MADEFQLGSGGNWWNSSRNRFDSSAGSSTTINSSSSNCYGSWPKDIADIKARSCTVNDSSVSSLVSGGGELLAATADPNLQLQIMGLGLSSQTQTMDWNNQALFRSGEKEQGSFRSMLQEDANISFQQELAASKCNSQDHDDHNQWRQKLFCDQDSSEFKHMSRGLSLDHQPQYSSHVNSTITCQGLESNFQVDSAVYGTSPTNSPLTILQGLIVPSDHGHQQQSGFDHSTRFMNNDNYSYHSTNYAAAHDHQQQQQLNMPAPAAASSWSKYPPFLRTSPPKQPQLHFSNNTPFWNNVSTTNAMNNPRSSFFPSLQPQQLPTPNFHEKPTKNASEVRDISSVAKKTSSEASHKRPRNETTTPMPAFKVRKEKMGDRITALQQLVSPFGKTDTASVLSEAIEYIKFLHEQVNVLSTPYMKNGAPIQHQQSCDQMKDRAEGAKQDLRSRGLCLVPVSSTFPVAHETTVDFWTPTFGGTFR